VQEQENTCFVSKTSWKDKIKKSIPENICVILMMVMDCILIFLGRRSRGRRPPHRWGFEITLRHIT